MTATSRVTLTQLQRQAAAPPHSAAPWLSLGHAHLARLELAAAADAFARAARLEPGNAASRFALADVLARQGHLACAVEALRAGLALSPRHAQAAANLGRLLARLGDDEAAAEAYGQAIAQAPIDRAESDSLYGLLLKDGYHGLADLAVARRAADAAEAWLVARAPRHAHQLMLRIALAAALGRAGRHAEAIAAWQRVMEQEPEHPLVFMGLAETWIRLGDLDAAARCCREALAIDPANAALLLAQADLLYRRGDVARVRRQMRDPALRFVLSRHWRSGDAAAPWDGTQPLDGQALLVDACDDPAACLLHGRLLLPRLAARGAHVMLQGTPDMAWLARLLPGVAQFVAPFDPCPPYAYRCRLRDLWLLLDWTWDDVAACPPLPWREPGAAATTTAPARPRTRARTMVDGADTVDSEPVDTAIGDSLVGGRQLTAQMPIDNAIDPTGVHHLLHAIAASRRDETTAATRWIGIAWSSTFDHPRAVPLAAAAACGASRPGARMPAPAPSHANAHERDKACAGAVACDPCTHRSAPLAAFEPLSRLDGVRLIPLDIALARPVTTTATGTATTTSAVTTPGTITPATTAIGTTSAAASARVAAAVALAQADVTSAAESATARIAEDCHEQFPSWLAGPIVSAHGTDAVMLLRALDAIVSVDTAAAHLAGALGRPCHLLLPHRPASHWQTDAPAFDGQRCVWYPSVRLHVQPRPGDWASLISAVAREMAVRS